MPNTSHSRPRDSIRRLLSPFRLLRATLWALAFVYFALGALVLVTRYTVLPNIQEFRPEVEAALSRSLGLTVRIERIDASWPGLRPHLALHGLRVHDPAGRPALAFDKVEADLAWRSLWLLKPLLHRLEIRQPVLDMRRDADGRIFIAGLALDTESEGGGFSDWLLSQRDIVIRDATIRWDDGLRRAPLLELTAVNLRLQNSGTVHRFGLTASPPPALAAKIDFRGDFRGEETVPAEEWKGTVFGELQYADLAVWRHWVDYPLELPQGVGGLRLWLDFDARRLAAITADVALRDVRLRLEHDLPMLDLAYLHGRLVGRRISQGYEASAYKLGLGLRGGMRIEPTDFEIRLIQGAEAATRGEFKAGSLDLAALAELAGYLPFEPRLRRSLAAYAPRGRMSEIRANWTGEGFTAHAYDFKARFEKLALQAQGRVPGFQGVSGRIEGNQRGGTLNLESPRARLHLPRVFPQPVLDLQQVTGRLDWSVADGVVEARLEHLSFQNKDAAGSAQGVWRGSADGPGEIDLSARLTRADGAAVWRYMPLVVDAQVRSWLRQSIVGGTAPEATLRLKGDLRDFPFRDSREGIFKVEAKVSNATLRYAPDWPEIQGINGALLFEGPRMLIRADSGTTLGTRLSGVEAQLADLQADEKILVIDGEAAGQVGDFLGYIRNSPVAQRAGSFTQDMSGTGEGRLHLKLTMPLRHITDTEVAGEYEFVRNRITVDPELPALTDVAGKLHFTADNLTIPGISASFLGGPLSLTGRTHPDGVVDVSLQGKLSVAGLREHLAMDVLDALNGSAAYRGNVRVKKAGTDVVLESDLRGISSALPPPFSKAATPALALRYERLPLPDATRGPSSLIRIGLGEDFRAQMVRRREGDHSVIDRAAIGIRETVSMPERGVAVAADLREFDVDQWRKLLPDRGAGDIPLLDIRLRTGELRAYGRKLTDFNGRASNQGDVWRARVSSREASGELTWQGQGKGRLHARLKHLALTEDNGTGTAPAQPPPRELPGLDVVAESFSIGGKPLGRLELNADNQGGMWKVERVSVANPDSTLQGSGQWQADSTQLNFQLEVNDSGALLDRLGYAAAMRRGAARMEGKVSWNGSPIAIDFPSLAGTLKLDVGQGQFNKLEPGVGRLLGILSLQALPRRISLDFRDIFSEGFAFDSIRGSARVDRGVMVTDNLQIRGPSAKILMTGEFDLAAETQKLRVRVQPSLSESVAVGATMLANPAVGLAALLAQKVLKDPLEQMFAFEYGVTGSWSDPKVEKLQTAVVKQDQLLKD